MFTMLNVNSQQHDSQRFYKYIYSDDRVVWLKGYNENQLKNILICK